MVVCLLCALSFPAWLSIRALRRRSTLLLLLLLCWLFDCGTRDGRGGKERQTVFRSKERERAARILGANDRDWTRVNQVQVFPIPSPWLYLHRRRPAATTAVSRRTVRRGHEPLPYLYLHPSSFFTVFCEQWLELCLGSESWIVLYRPCTARNNWSCKSNHLHALHCTCTALARRGGEASGGGPANSRWRVQRTFNEREKACNSKVGKQQQQQQQQEIALS